MATIDQYKHRHLGFINCPSDYDIVYNNPTRDVAVYHLLEEIPEHESNFDGKSGDLIIGGGSGGVPAFRITFPEALDLLVFNKDVVFDHYDELFKAFWTPTESYKLCNGFRKLGWNAIRPVEFWLTENICATLINEVESFRKFGNGQRFASQLRWMVP